MIGILCDADKYNRLSFMVRTWLLRIFVMDSDDIIYCVLLLVSLFAGHLVKLTNGYVARQRLVSGVGVVMVIVVCRQHCLHALLSAVVNAIVLLLVSARSVFIEVLSNHSFTVCKIFHLLFSSFVSGHIWSYTNPYLSPCVMVQITYACTYLLL